MKPIRLAMACCLLFLALPVQAQKPAGNAEQVAGQMLPPVLDILARHATSPGPLVVDGRGSDGLSVWLAHIFSDSCLARDYFVYSTPDSAPAALRVTLSGATAAIRYEPAGRSWRLTINRWRRIVETRLQVHLERDGRVLVSRELSETRSDVVPAEALPAIESPRYPFLTGTKRGSSIFKRWLEPAAVMATTGAVVFLFYRLRSDS